MSFEKKKLKKKYILVHEIHAVENDRPWQWGLLSLNFSREKTYSIFSNEKDEKPSEIV